MIINKKYLNKSQEKLIEAFKDEMEDIMVKIFDISMEEMAKSADMTVDEVYASIGYTREEYLEMRMTYEGTDE